MGGVLRACIGALGLGLLVSAALKSAEPFAFLEYVGRIPWMSGQEQGLIAVVIATECAMGVIMLFGVRVATGWWFVATGFFAALLAAHLTMWIGVEASGASCGCYGNAFVDRWVLLLQTLVSASLCLLAGKRSPSRGWSVGNANRLIVVAGIVVSGMILQLVFGLGTEGANRYLEHRLSQEFGSEFAVYGVVGSLGCHECDRQLELARRQVQARPGRTYEVRVIGADDPRKPRSSSTGERAATLYVSHSTWFRLKGRALARGFKFSGGRLIWI